MLAGLKLFKTENNYCEKTFGATVFLKNLIQVTGKQLRQRLVLIKVQVCSNFLQKAASATCLNVYIFLKTEYKHQVT